MKKLFLLCFLVFNLIGSIKAHAFDFTFTGNYIDDASVNNPPIFDIHHTSNVDDLFPMLIQRGFHSASFQFLLENNTKIKSLLLTASVLPGVVYPSSSGSIRFEVYSESLEPSLPGPNNLLYESLTQHYDDELDKLLPFVRSVDVGEDFKQGLYWLTVSGGPFLEGDAKLGIYDIAYDGVQSNPIPEPLTFCLLSLGILGCFVRFRRVVI